MDLLFLTKTGGILKPFAIVLGWIINYIYVALEKIGIPNIGLAIILFTLIVNLILLPMTIKQQKYTKLSAIMNPEIQKIQAKYKDKKDEVSVRRMQAETQAVYQKYGTSATGGCLYMIIQMPILFALYRVIYNIPAYVDSVHALYETIAAPIFEGGIGNLDILNNLMTSMEVKNIKALTQETFNINGIIDVLYNVKTTGWSTVVSTFNLTGVQEAIDKILSINGFVGGLNISDPPMANGWWPGILIPILSGVTQWLSIKITSAQNGTDKNKNKNKNTVDENPMNGSMKMMNTLMPLMSVFICFSIQTGLGIYWIASAVFRTVISVIINKFLDKQGIDKIIEKNKEKAKKKAERRGDKPSKFEEYAKMSAKHIEAAEAAQKRRSIAAIANSSVEGKSSASEPVKNTTPAAKVETSAAASGKKGKKEEKPANIAAYANMLKK